MSIQVKCPDCCIELTFPDRMAGNQVRCMRCAAEFLAPAAAESRVAEPASRPTPILDDMPRTIRRSRVEPEPEPIRRPKYDREEKPEPARRSRVEPEAEPESVRRSRREPVAEPERPSRSSAPTREERLRTTPVPKSGRAGPKLKSKDEDSVSDVEEVEEVDVANDQPRKKKKEKKKRARKREPGMPAWVWWLIAGGVGTTTFLLLLLVALVALKREAIGYVLALIVLMPVSTVILILSMYVSSAIGGGIDFGDARTGIPKAAVLLFVINCINLSPCGAFGGALTLPIWIIGLMGLFKIDFWETRILLAVNWIFNFIARILVFGLFISTVSQMSADMTERHVMKIADPEEISKIGGDYGTSPLPGHPVNSIRLQGPEFTDESIDVVLDYTEVERLDLSGSRVTDRGIRKLEEMQSLKVLIITNTQVSKRAASDLQKALPDLTIVR